MRNNNTTGFITERERAVMARLSYEKADSISRPAFDRMFSVYPKNVRSKLIYRLKKKGVLKRIKNGLYIYSPIEAGPQGRNISEFKVAALLFPRGDYYAGYSVMYNFYGFTGQVFQVVHLLNTSRQYRISAGGVRFELLKVPRGRMFGITEIDAGGTRVKVSDRERTLVDLLYYPEPVGGLKAAYRIMAEKIRDREINIPVFLGYLARFPAASVRQRAGFMLESAGIRTRRLVKTINPRSLVALYGGRSRKGRIDKKWGIIVNDTR